jgi:phosphoribosylanthranilate isomerase
VTFVNKNKPYIGITGFTRNADVLTCLSAIPAEIERLFMVGVLLSSKTINGGTNKYPVRYPHYNSIKDIFTNDSRCLNMIHYVTDDKTKLVKQLLDAAEIGGENCHGFQLNIVWPDIDMLKEVKKELPNHKFVIQCSGGAMRRFENEIESSVPKLLHTVVKEYQVAGVIDYLLIDPSGGRGKAFDAQTTIKMLAPHFDQEDYQLGVAGGLKCETINNLIPVMAKYPFLFWDAEGGLRDTDDSLIVNAATEYLDASFELDSLLHAKEIFNERKTIAS